MNSHFFNRMFWGIGLIGVGVLFLLNEMGKIDIDLGYIFSTYWPVILIFFGLKGILVKQRYHNHWGGHYFWNLLIVLIGLVFLGNNLDVVELSIGDLFQYLIPILLILFGIQVIFRSNNDSRPPKAPVEHIPNNNKPEAEPYAALPKITPEAEPYVPHPKYTPEMPHPKHNEFKKHHSNWTNWSSGAENRSSFIGDIHLGHDYWELRSMNISSFIGDTVIDLTKAHISPGETKINISTFMGDVKVFVPNDMEVGVSVASTNFLGDIKVFEREEGGFARSMKVDSPHYNEAEKKILIAASMFIGDVKVQRVG